MTPTLPLFFRERTPQNYHRVSCILWSPPRNRSHWMTHKLYMFFVDAPLESLSPNVSMLISFLCHLATFWSKSGNHDSINWKATVHTTQNLSFLATPQPHNRLANLSPTWCCLIQIRSRTIQWRNAMFLEGTFDTFLQHVLLPPVRGQHDARFGFLNDEPPKRERERNGFF